MDEEARIQSMFLTLTPFQQEQIRTKCVAYEASLTGKPITVDIKARVMAQFRHTLIKAVYEKQGGRGALVSQNTLVRAGSPPPPPGRPPVRYYKAVPPPPPTKPHPLAVSGKSPYSQTFSGSYLVDKSNGLLTRLFGSGALPTGLQDWVNRVFSVFEKTQPALRFKADSYVTDAMRILSTTGELWKTNWVVFPLPSIQVLATYRPESGDIVRKIEIVDLIETTERCAKSRKTHVDSTSEFIALKSVRVSPTATSQSGQRLSKAELNKRSKRAHKYRDHLVSPTTSSPEPSASEAVNVQYEFGNDEDDIFEKTGQFSVIGTCTKMDKRYLRLTAAPDPSLVRPEPVLRNWVDELARMWKSKEKEWKYVEDQMRAIRQDLTVQNIRGDFTSQVYELNARWALESGDMGQFNQCQTQLKQLHWSDKTVSDVKAEFISYRLLYYFFMHLRVDEQLFLSQVLAMPDYQNHPFVVFALEIRRSTTTNNFSKYFELVKIANGILAPGPNHGIPASHTKFLLHAFEARQRLVALLVLTKAFATQLAVPWLSNLLGFDSEEECTRFLEENGAVYKSSAILDPKACFPVFSNSPLLVSSKLKLMG